MNSGGGQREKLETTALRGVCTLKLDGDPTDNVAMSEEKRGNYLAKRAASTADFSFLIFSLSHAECGEQGVIELRLGERVMLGWCPLCAVLRTFESPD